MDAEIIGKDDRGVGVNVVDNVKIEHTISVGFDGNVQGHGSDGYPDKTDDRTLEQNEHVAQAQRFAKYYVYRQRGHDTRPPLPNPDRISAVAAFVDALSPETFEEYFGDYYQQMLSEQDQAEPVVDVPEEARTNPLYYRKDVYLNLSHEALHSVVTDSDQSAFETLQTAASDGRSSLSNLVQKLTDQQVDNNVDEHSLADAFTEAVSGVHVMWSPANNQTETIETDLPDIDRKPDARFELPPYEPDSLEEFRDTLLYHLKCQIRDCYLTMGVAPPEELRIQGPGWFDRSTWFQHYDVYEPYHRTDVDITNWQVQHTPDEFSY